MKEFANTRARLLKVGDLSSFYGWVEPGAEGVLVVDSDDSPEARYGDEFNIELKTSQIGTIFQSSYMGSEGNLHLFSVPAAFSIERRKNADARRRNLVKHALYKSTDGPVILDVLDVSKHGIAFRSQLSFPSGISLHLYVTLPGSLDKFVEMEVEIRYSKKQTNEAGGFRYGCQITEMMRADRVKWDLLIESPIDVSA